MNFYPFNIGDYSAATRHLTWEEDIAYRRLLDAYYNREEPIPLDRRQAYRLVIAQTEAQRVAVDTVLQEFFIETEYGWVNARCDEVITQFNDKKNKASHSANERWRNAKSESVALPPESERNANEQNTACERIKVDSVGNATNTITNTNTNTKDKSNTSGKPDFPVRFDEFWDCWPSTSRKVAKSKCAEIWRRKSLAKQADAIIAHVSSMRESKQWRDGYEPAPLTYLNQSRWFDGLPNSQKQLQSSSIGGLPRHLMLADSAEAA